MAQNFWTAIVAWACCFVMTVAVSLVTRQKKSEEELCGLVYSLTPRPRKDSRTWYRRPAALGTAVLLLSLVLNLIFW